MGTVGFSVLNIVRKIDTIAAEEGLLIKRRTAPRPPRSSRPFAWVGMVKDGPTDASAPEAIDAALAQGFGR